MYRLAALLLLTGKLLLSVAYAQAGDGEHRPDFTYTKETEPWFASYNAAGLYKFSLSNISLAEAFINKDNGKFVNYFRSDDSYRFGLQTESYYRLGTKTVLSGNVSYNNFKGKHMGGSSFLDPYGNPFDLVEYADSTAGEKQLEQYYLNGAVSIGLSEDLHLGVKVDYKTANYAKFKDLRHKNKLLDMYLTLGVSYVINNVIELGANYFYRRSTEGIMFKSYGNTDQQFYTLVSFGSFYGHRESFGDTGYTKDGDDVPLFNEFHGGSLQMQFSLSSRMKFFNEFTYKSRSGYYGKRSPSTVVYTEHQSGILEYKGVFSLKSAHNHHLLALATDREALDNNENIYKVDNTSGNNKDVIYYGSNKVLDREIIHAKLEYTGNLNVVNCHPVWVLKAGASFFQRKQTSYLYPYFRKQTIHSMQFVLSGGKNLFSKENIYTFHLNTGFSSGGGTKKEDSQYTSGSEGGSNPASLDVYLNREFEYLTASQITAGAKFRYTRTINKDMALYAGIGYQFVKALDIEYLSGSTFGSLNVSIGCNF